MKGKWSCIVKNSLKCVIIFITYFTLISAEVEPKEEEESKPTEVRHTIIYIPINKFLYFLF